MRHTLTVSAGGRQSVQGKHDETLPSNHDVPEREKRIAQSIVKRWLVALVLVVVIVGCTWLWAGIFLGIRAAL